MKKIHNKGYNMTILNKPNLSRGWVFMCWQSEQPTECKYCGTKIVYASIQSSKGTKVIWAYNFYNTQEFHKCMEKKEFTKILTDPYIILGVSKNNLTDIDSNYRTLVKLYHPDISKNPDTAIMFRLIINAYRKVKK